MIIIEGFDGSGKSKLATRLSNDLGPSVPIFHQAGRPMSNVDTYQRVLLSLSACAQPVIQDRCSIISEAVYGDILRKVPLVLWRDAVQILKGLNPMIIYCRPPERIIYANHEPNQLDDKKYLKTLDDNKHKILRGYDAFFDSFKRLVIYDWTCDNPRPEFRQYGYDDIMHMAVAKIRMHRETFDL